MRHPTSTSKRTVTDRLEGPLAGFEHLLLWAVRLVWLNFWWTLLTVLGGIVLGVGPATVAAHTVATAGLQHSRVHLSRDVGARGGAAGGQRPAPSSSQLSCSSHWPPPGTPRAVRPLFPPPSSRAWRWPACSRWGRPPTTHTCPGSSHGIPNNALPITSPPLSRSASDGLSSRWSCSSWSSGGRSCWPYPDGLLPVCGVSVPLTAGAWCIHKTLGHRRDADDDLQLSDAHPQEPAPAGSHPERIR